MELTSGLLSRDDYLCAIDGVVKFLAGAGVRDVLVAYGFGCDCPDEQLYQDVPIPLDKLPSFIAHAEGLDFYRVGKDNLHIKDSKGHLEFLFCHESDIHFISEDADLIAQLKAVWLAEGHRKIPPHLGTE